MTTLHGIKNCDTIKKARKWLEQQNIPYQFYDYRVDGLEKQWLIKAETVLGWQQMLNTRGTTFRKLEDDQKTGLDQHKAIDLMLEYPSMIKRPLLIHNKNYFLGFKPDHYAEIFND